MRKQRKEKDWGGQGGTVPKLLKLVFSHFTLPLPPSCCFRLTAFLLHNNKKMTESFLINSAGTTGLTAKE